jgi:hypothetical protein
MTFNVPGPAGTFNVCEKSWGMVQETMQNLPPSLGASGGATFEIYDLTLVQWGFEAKV